LVGKFPGAGELQGSELVFQCVAKSQCVVSMAQGVASQLLVQEQLTMDKTSSQEAKLQSAFLFSSL
jgi:hypothetical protein